MQKFCSKGFLILLLFVISFIPNRSIAQIDVAIGSGTTTNTDWTWPCPLPDMVDASRMQFLFLASELSAAGMSAGTINAIRFTVTDLGMYVDPSNPNNSAADKLTLKIGTTATASLSTNGWEPNTNTVFTANSHLPTLGANSFAFNSPFYWNGVDNIVIEICTDASNGSTRSANPYITYTTGLPFNASRSIGENFLGGLCDKNNNAVRGDQTTRPNIIFNWTVAQPCTNGSLTAGTAVSNKVSVCMNETFRLGLNGSSMATGLTYQWQSSANGLAWTDIANATEASLSLTQTATSWYRCIVTCSSGGTATSASIQVLTPLPLSGTFTIDKSLPAGSGNFKTFNDAYNHIKCGINGPVVFNVAPNSGIYNEQLIIEPIPGASAVNTITFNGAPGAAIEYNADNQDQRAIIKLNGADYFRFNNLTVNATATGYSGYGYCFQLLNDADFNIINNCTINTDVSSNSANYAGIVVNGSDRSATQEMISQCDNNIFQNNTITGGYYGITLVSASSAPNGSNIISKNKLYDFALGGIYVACSFNTQIDSNLISRPVRSEDYATVYGIYAININTRLAISKNTITHIFNGASDWASFYGIYFTSAASVGGLENVVSNNLIYNINGGATVYGIYNSLSHNALYHHNTVSLDGIMNNAINDNFVTGFYLEGATGVQLYNNNISVTRDGPATNTAIWFATFSSDIQSNNNNLYVSPGVGVRRTGYVHGNNRLLLNNWVAATGLDNNSIAADPVFVNLATGDLHPGNPALNNMGATTTGITTDITGVTRNSPPDAGAFEINPPACTTPPTAGTAAFNKSAVCVGESVTFDLTGNTIGAVQTYQLQSAAAAAGPFTAEGSLSTNPVFFITATTTKFYRISVTCSGNTAITPPVELTVFQAFPSGTYTINKNAPASATNFVSFNAAYGALGCGISGPVVFDVVAGSGPYNEQLIIDTIKGTSITNTVTFNGNGNTLQFSSNSNDERAVIKLRSADHFIFDNLVIDATGAGAYGYGVQLLKNADSNIIKNCTINANTGIGDYAGIVVSAMDTDPTATGNTWCDGNLFTNNTISGGNYGITLAGDPVYFSWMSNFIYDNKIVNNTITDFYEMGIYVNGTSGTVIEGNILSRPQRASVGDFQGVFVQETNAEILINRNKFSNPFGGAPNSTQAFYAIYSNMAGHETKGIISNNIIYNVNGLGAMYGFYCTSTRNMAFYHNTVSFDNQTVPGNNTAGASGFYTTNTVENLEFKNNIVTITKTGSGQKFGFNIASGDVIPLSMDKNDYYIKGPNGNNYIGYRNSPRATLSEWQSVTARDLHSYSIDPVYANLASGNLAPTIAPLNDNGDALGILTDINNATRSTATPDIGAYEFIPAPCISGVIAGNTVVTPNSGICMGTQLTLTLTGNTTSGYQTYRWQKAASAAGPWVYISDSLYVSEFKTEATGNAYYRCVVSCTGINDTSAIAQVQLNAPLPGGIYTINNGGAGDYASFTAAVNAMQCGIAGEVIFDVAPGTYNEQVYLRRIPGASAGSRVTFRSATGNAADVILTAAGTSANNYVLKIDSAGYLTFKGLTISATSNTYGRVVEFAGTASFDSLINNIITTPATTSTSNTRTAIYASPVKAESIVISGNAIRNGASGIYIAGTSINRSKNLVIENNAINGFYQYGIYTTLCNNTRITGNELTVAAPLATTSYAINSGNNDSSYNVSANRITINNTSATVYGISVSASISQLANAGRVDGNRVVGITGNTGTLYGMNVVTSQTARIVNNAISIRTNGNASYGLFTNNNIDAQVYNNTVVDASANGNNNYAAYISDNNYNDANYIDVRNNIFSHEGGGKAMYVNNIEHMYSDYNMLYTTGATLVLYDSWVGASYATLADWQAGGDLDKYSIVYKPALISTADPRPDVNAPEVWAMHGRGIQLNGNDHDFNNAPRPVSLKAGVPDLGAYEFMPVAAPPVCVASPAAPVANAQQVFTLGTDVVATINWGAAVPAGVTMKRFSGVMPTGLTAGTDHMYFYTDVAITGGGTYSYDIEQNYLDPWRGFINNENRIRLGRTDVAGTWVVDAASTVNTVSNNISQTGLTYLNRLTGLTNGTIPYPPSDSARTDSSNMGTRFWVGYGHNNNVTTFIAKIGGSARDANVTVKVHGTAWVRNYHIPANTFINTDPIPRTGASGAVLLTEGISDRGISIESDEPVSAFVEASGALAVTGSTLLVPVGSYGYEYYALAWEQKNYDLNVYSWFYVIADHDSTMVEITPSNPTLGGRVPNVPFVVTLNKGEVYQVLGAKKSENDGFDLSGSKVRSLSNLAGKCYPVAVFSGNSRAFIDCAESFVPFGNYLIQQGSPAETWGTQYLTAPTAKYNDPTAAQTNFYRILVKDPATVVRVNGQVLSNPVNNYYQYQSNTADFIEATRPVLVAEFIPGSSNICDFGNTAPEMFYIPAIDQGVRKADFYRSNISAFGDNYLTVVIPTNGVASLSIDGSNKFDSTYTHPGKAGYTVVLKRWQPADAASTVQSDSAFIALNYGLGGIDSYGVLAGKAIPASPTLPGITNIYDSSGNYSAFTCVGTPFRYSVLLPVMPTSITWKFSQAANMVPNADSVQMNPVPVQTQLVNGRTYYRFALDQDYVFPATGIYSVPVEYVHPVIASCTNTAQAVLTITVAGTPVVDIDAITTGCVGDSVQFSAIVTGSFGDVVHQLTWDFGDNTTAVGLTPSKLYAGAATYTVKADAITKVGCIASTSEPVTLKGPSVIEFVSDTVKGCAGSNVVLSIRNPQSGVAYNWYNTETGGTAAHTGTSVTISAISATKTYYVDATADGCTTRPRKAVTALYVTGVNAPVVRVDSTGAQMIKFSWSAVPGVTAYQVSVNGGITWATPSSGPGGLQHTVTGLQPGQNITLRVKAVDPDGCTDGIGEASATAVMDDVFMPNAFTPNGDNLNDVFKLEGLVVKSMQLRVFNQWGEMIFETADQSKGWDGTYKGKLQPSGVYMYVCSMVLADGSKLVKKGSVNLVR
ncbi:gliding motility-associated C-terminal domain-containing protein [Niastella populi]|uniref:Ig-like domain-containing protein n=1 Tax=Niastella populi TaxID=550983 RepID=A0A1V9ERX5_9BACT|nr:gliding motility-associated C-terminal domain-containing protein [Niastella populi]OQP48899.1 hypothetical protein A4R26_07280 [Niastella populi]